MIEISIHTIDNTVITIDKDCYKLLISRGNTAFDEADTILLAKEYYVFKYGN